MRQIGTARRATDETDPFFFRMLMALMASGAVASGLMVVVLSYAG